MSAPGKAQIKPDSPTRGLWQIAKTGDLQQLLQLLVRGADVNASNESGVTPLMVAAFHGRLEMVRALTDHGADLNATDHDGFTAVMLAEHGGHEEIVRTLLARRETKPFKSDSSKTSPLPLTHDETFAELSDSDVTPTIRNPEVRTLHEPPEIWDLVHETPTEFAPGSAFVGHLTSINHLMLAAIALIVVGGAVFGFMKLKSGSGSDQAASAAPPPASVPAPSSAHAASTTRAASTTPAGSSPAVAATASAADEGNGTAASGAQVIEPKPTTLSSNHKATGTPDIAISKVDSKITGVAPSLAAPSEATSLAATSAALPAMRVVSNRRRENKTSSTAAGNATAAHDPDKTPTAAAADPNEKAVDRTAAKKEEDKAAGSQSTAPAKTSATPKAKVIPWP